MNVSVVDNPGKFGSDEALLVVEGEIKKISSTKNSFIVGIEPGLSFIPNITALSNLFSDLKMFLTNWR